MYATIRVTEDEARISERISDNLKDTQSIDVSLLEPEGFQELDFNHEEENHET